MLAYTFLGGLTSAIYNEVLQFFLIVMGFSPLAIMAVAKAGGWSGMSERLRDDLPAGHTGDVMVTAGNTWATPPTIRWGSSGSAWSPGSGS